MWLADCREAKFFIARSRLFLELEFLWRMVFATMAGDTTTAAASSTFAESKNGVAADVIISEGELFIGNSTIIPTATFKNIFFETTTNHIIIRKYNHSDTVSCTTEFVTIACYFIDGLLLVYYNRQIKANFTKNKQMSGQLPTRAGATRG